MSQQTSVNPDQRPVVSALRERPQADVLIIGAGINGIATFWDLALQGVDAVIVDKGDFVSGASAASSHMIHGGIRYLENGEFRLVRESVEERNGLIRTAPHYVKPLHTTVPIFSTFSGVMSAPLKFLTHKSGKPTERGAALIKIGLSFYDAFSGGGGGTVPRHEFRGRKSSLHRLPRLNPGIKYTATYYDASMHDPERLALDVLHDGLEAQTAGRAANYVEAVGSADGAVVLRDVLTGEEFPFTAKAIVNTSGPWTDLTNEALGTPSRYMGGTKGSHIVVDNPELLAATGGGEIFFENNDGRIVLIYPLKGKVMIGTTDLEHDMHEPIRCTEEEVDYFFELVSHVFPDIRVDRSQIVFRFSGVRPLPRHDASSPGSVSRDYAIERGTLAGTAVPALSLVGGKWTTFRALAEHLSTEVLGLLGRTRTTSTEGREIGGGRDFPVTGSALTVWLGEHAGPVGRERAEQLLERYGTRAEQIIAELGDDTPLAEAPEYSVEEIAWLAEHEQVARLDDLVLRRTSLAFTGKVTTPLLRELLAVAAPLLGWDDARADAELTRAIELLHDRHGLDLDAAVSSTTH